MHGQVQRITSPHLSVSWAFRVVAAMEAWQVCRCFSCCRAYAKPAAQHLSRRPSAGCAPPRAERLGAGRQSPLPLRPRQNRQTFSLCRDAGFEGTGASKYAKYVCRPTGNHAVRMVDLASGPLGLAVQGLMASSYLLLKHPGLS